MKVWARINHIGWVHLWLSRESYEAGEPSSHFFNGRSEPRWAEVPFTEAMLGMMKRGELVEMEDPGYFSEEDAADGAAEKDSSPW